MTAVSNTGPLIALAKVDKLSLLEKLFGQLFIPPAVYRELLAKCGPESARLDDALVSFIEVATIPSLAPEVKTTTMRLDSGEQQAVALAYERKVVLVIDERLGRTAARRLGLTITGVIGVLIRAKEAGLIQAVCPLLNEACQQGYWLSDEALDVAAKLAGEDEKS
jgi:predicted nucleic acid-binding protein